MSFLIDEVARIVASPMPRRKALKLLGGALSGAVLASLSGRQAKAQASCSSNCGPLAGTRCNANSPCEPCANCCCGPSNTCVTGIPCGGHGCLQGVPTAICCGGTGNTGFFCDQASGHPFCGCGGQQGLCCTTACTENVAQTDCVAAIG